MSIFSKITKKGFLIVIIVMIMYVTLTIYSDVEEFSKKVFEINYGVLPFVFITMTINLLLLGFRFYRLIQNLGINISLRKSILIYFASLSLLPTPAGSGQIIKSHIIKQETGEPISKTIPITFIEKWNELNSIIVFLAILVAIGAIFETQIILIIAISLSIFFAGIMLNEKIFLIFKKIVKKIKPLKKFEDNIQNSQNTIKGLMNPRTVLEGFVITTPAKILEAITVFLTFYALSIDLDFVILTQIFFTSVASGFLSLIPGGFFVTEASMLGLLTKYGIDFSVATVAVILVRIVTIWYATVLGLVASKFFIGNKSN